jgi:hypothetical protein
LIYISSVFFIGDIRNSERFEYFSEVLKVLITYILPAFALYSAWLFLTGYNGRFISSEVMVGWYLLLFISIDLIILYPTIALLKLKSKSIFARIYFSASTFIFGFLMGSELTGDALGYITRRQPNLILIDKTMFTWLSYLEIPTIILILISLFKIADLKKLT